MTTTSGNLFMSALGQISTALRLAGQFQLPVGAREVASMVSLLGGRDRGGLASLLYHAAIRTEPTLLGHMSGFDSALHAAVDRPGHHGGKRQEGPNWEIANIPGQSGPTFGGGDGTA